MPIADLIILWNDRMHISQTSRVVTASSTDSGYSPDYAREADLVRAWKPNDSVSTTEWLKVDGAQTSFIGLSAASPLVYVAVAYDGRGVNQNKIKLQYDSVDDGAFGGTITTQWDHTITKNAVTCAYLGWTLAADKRWYRLAQLGTDRSGGNVTAKIYYWAMFGSGDSLTMSVNYPKSGEGPWKISQVSRTARATTAGGAILTNEYAKSGQRFTVTWEPAESNLWQSIRDKLDANNGQHRAVFVQKEGLKNDDVDNFFLCRLVGASWSASKQYVDGYFVELEFETEPWL